MSQVPISDSTLSIASSPNIDLMQVAPLLKNTCQVVELAEPAYSATLDPSADAPREVIVPRHDGTRCGIGALRVRRADERARWSCVSHKTPLDVAFSTSGLGPATAPTDTLQERCARRR